MMFGTAIKSILGGVSFKAWAWIVVGLFVALGAFAGWQWAQRQAAEVRAAHAAVAAAEAQRGMEVFRGAYNTLSATAAEQNSAVRTMQQEGARRAKEGAAALAKARADGEAWRRSADRMRAILATPMPMTCDEAVQAAKDAL